MVSRGIWIDIRRSGASAVVVEEEGCRQRWLLLDGTAPVKGCFDHHVRFESKPVTVWGLKLSDDLLRIYTLCKSYLHSDRHGTACVPLLYAMIAVTALDLLPSPISNKVRSNSQIHPS